MDDITVPEYCISRIDLRRRNHALLQSQVWMWFRRKFRTSISSSASRFYSRKIWSRDVFIIDVIERVLKCYGVSGLTELPVIGIVYIFRVRRHCWAEERSQNHVCIREQNIRVKTSSALGWSGLTGLNHQSANSLEAYHDVKKITS